MDTPTNYKVRAFAEAVAEKNLEAAILSAQERIEIERGKIEAFINEALVRGEIWSLLEADGIDAALVTSQQYAMARLKAEAIVDADAAIQAMEARLTARKDG